MSAHKSWGLLVIDHDPATFTLASQALGDDFEIHETGDAQAGYDQYIQTKPAIVLVDASMPTGIDLMERMIAFDPGTNVILLGQQSADLAIEAIQKGASDYLTKPLDPEKIRNRVSNVVSQAAIRRKTLALDQELLSLCQFEGIVSRSPLMLEVFAKIRCVARHFRTVLLSGATGTGKELVAQALHRLSPSQPDRFVAFNCSGLVETLAESELFGHLKGSFTGAVQDRPGLFESADRGTIFLDEVGELSLGIQAKLLRVLQERSVRRVGSSSQRSIDVRVIAATNRNLRAMVREGRFREDLYYRIAVVPIDLPPLADRREDLPLLVRFFLQKYASQYNKSVAGLTRRAQARLAAYPWPGNVRELENVIAHACMMSKGRFIDLNDLAEWLRERTPGWAVSNDALLSLEEMQKRHILRVLELVGGNKVRAAEILGVGRATIYQTLAKMRENQSGSAKCVIGKSHATIRSV